MLPTPPLLAERINKLTFNFIWEGKPAKIKKKTIIAERKHGGLKMMDFEIMEKALQIAWVNRIKDESSASWKIIPEQILTQYGGLSFLTNCDYDFKLLDLRNLPTFYHFVLRYWQDYKLLMPGNRRTPEHEIIRNNQNILVDKKPLFCKSWFHHDIVQVQDLLNVNREFLSLADFKQKFNIDTPFTLYHGLINANPIEWKDQFGI